MKTKLTRDHIGKVAGCFAVTLGMVASVSAQVQYAVVDIGTLPGYQWTRGQSLNNKGHVAGFSSPSGSFGSSLNRAFFWDGVIHNIGLLSIYDNDSAGYGLNDLDQVVGISQYSSPFSYYTPNAFIWDYKNGMKSIINSINPGRSSEVFSINNAGASVGTILIQSLGYYPYLFPGNGTEIEKTNASAWGHAFKINNSGVILTQSSRQYIPGDPQKFYIWEPNSSNNYEISMSRAYDLNDRNVVCGEYTDINGLSHACTWTQKGGVKDIPIPENVFSSAVAINNLGDVIGSYRPVGSGSLNYFLYSKSQFYNLNSLVPNGGLSGSTTIVDINDRGEILINTDRGSGNVHAYLLSRDTDGDGIPDEWEENGYDAVDSHGIIRHIDLKNDYGADSNHKDVYVWVDHLASIGHSHKLDDEAKKLVTEAFKNAPVSNPDGISGIRIHIIEGNEITEQGIQLGRTIGNQYIWFDFNAIKDSSFPKELSNIFHYCLMGHNGPTQNGSLSSGLSRGTPGSDFMVALGSFGKKNGPSQVSIITQASTFMHELGHNLGLGHGGSLRDIDQANINDKPNYLSIMNYSYQLFGLIKNSKAFLDYSRFSLKLDESKLNEYEGVAGGSETSSFGVRWWTKLAGQSPLNFSLNNCNIVDWNSNGTFETNIKLSFNKDGGTPDRILKSSNDWDQLIYSGGKIGFGINGFGSEPLLPETTLVDEADAETLKATLPVTPSGLTMRIAGRAVRLAWNQIGQFGDDRYKIYRKIGSGEYTLVSITSANAFMDSLLPVGQIVNYYIKSTSIYDVDSSPSNTVSGRIN